MRANRSRLDAVLEAEKDWQAHVAGRRRLSATRDAAEEVLMAFLPDFANLAIAVSVLKERGLVR